MVDAHAHIFNGADIPARGFLHHTFGARTTQFIGDVLGPAFDALALIALAAPEAGTESTELLDLLLGARAAAPPPIAAAKELPVADEQLARKLVSDAIRARLGTSGEQLDRMGPTGARLRKLQGRAAMKSKGPAMMTAEELLELVLDEEDEAKLSELAFGPSGKELPTPRSLALAKERVTRMILDTLTGFTHFVKLTTSSRLQQANELVRTYGQIRLFLPALVDFDRWTGFRSSQQGEDRSRSQPAAQIPVIERLSKLAIQGKLGDGSVRLHAMVAFDPRREAEDFPQDYGAGWSVPAQEPPLPAPTGPWVQRTVPTEGLPGSFLPMRYAIEHGGFAGVKLYPPVGFKPMGNGAVDVLQEGGLGLRIDNALHRLYAYCQREEVPILAHMGTSNAFEKEFASNGHPANWAGVLAQYPGLRINFGHFGHSDGFPKGSADYAQTWAYAAAALVQQYEHVYADLSNADVATEPDFMKLLAFLVDRFPKVKTRLLYGSDWFMNSLQGIRQSFFQGMLDTMQATFAGLGERFIEDFMGGNALRFLGLVDDEGKRRDGALRRRLQAFYADNPQPDWLR